MKMNTKQINTESSNGQTASTGVRAPNSSSSYYQLYFDQPEDSEDPEMEAEFGAGYVPPQKKRIVQVDVGHAVGTCNSNFYSMCEKCVSLRRLVSNIKKHSSINALFAHYFFCLSKNKSKDMQRIVLNDMNYLKKSDDKFRHIFDRAYRVNRNSMTREVRFNFSSMFATPEKAETVARNEARDEKYQRLHAQGLQDEIAKEFNVTPSSDTVLLIHERGQCVQQKSMCADCVSIRKLFYILQSTLTRPEAHGAYYNAYMRIIGGMSTSFAKYVVMRDAPNMKNLTIAQQRMFVISYEQHADLFEAAGNSEIIKKLRDQCTFTLEFNNYLEVKLNDGNVWREGPTIKKKKEKVLKAQGLWNGEFNLNVSHNVPTLDALITSISGMLHAHNVQANIERWSRTLASLCIMLFQLCTEGTLQQKVCGVLQFLLHLDLPGLNIQQYAQSLAQVFQGMVNRVTTTGLHAQGDSDAFDENILFGTAKLICALTGITSYEQGVSTKRVKKLDALARMVTSWEKIYAFATKLFEYAFVTVTENVYGIRPEVAELERLDREIPQWMDDVSSYYNDNGLFRCTQSRKEALTVANWKRMADKYQAMIVKCRAIPFPAQACFRNAYSMCLKMFDASQHFHSSSSLRAAPLVMYLYGAAGIGKTITQHMLISSIMTSVMKARGEIYVPGRDVYTRNSTQEHWDAYNRQAVVIYDDYLQARDTTQMTEQLMDLLRIKNNQSWPLKMADLASKGNTYFDTELVLITSNIDIPADARTAVRSVTAIRRRVDLMIEQVLIDEYKNKGNGALNRKKLVRDFPPIDTGHGLIMADTTSIHRYNVRDPEDRIIMEEGTYEELVALCIDTYDASHTQDAQMIGRLNWEAGLMPNGSPRETLVAQGRISDAYDAVSSKVFGIKETIWPSLMTDLEDEEVMYSLNHEIPLDSVMLRHWTPAQHELRRMLIADRQRDSRTWRDSITPFVNKLRKTWKSITLLSFYDMFLLIFGAYCGYKLLFPAVFGKKEVTMRAENNSGDEKTRQQQSRLRTEASSGDEKTRAQQSRIRAEGSNTSRACVMMEDGGELHAQACSDMVAYNIAASKITNNAMVISTHIPNSTKVHTMRALFVVGRTFIAPLHAFHELDINNTDVTLVNMHGVKMCFNTSECGVISDARKDLVFIEIPKRFNNFVDIRSHFHNEKAINKNTLKEAMLWVVDGENKTRMATYCNNLEQDKILDYEVTRTTGDIDRVSILKSYKYNGITRDGFCGAPLLWLNPSVQGGHILGIHVAGADNIGLANVMTREYVMDKTSNMTGISIEVPELEVARAILSAQSAVNEKTGVMYYGQVPSAEQVRSPNTTKILKSPLYGTFDPVTRPAMLRPTGDINPMALGIKKQVAPLTLFDQNLVDLATKHLAHTILSRRSRYSDTGVLTESEALNGIAGDPWITPMDMHTSPGYPYILNRESPGKFSFVNGEPGSYSLKSVVGDKLHERIKCAQQRVIPWTVFVDILKDERRPNAKVDIGKTRIFNVAPFDFNVAMRQYCQAFVAHMMDDHIYGECSVGINPHSDEWGLMYRHLTNLSSSWIGGDYGNYDKTLSYQLLQSVCEIINEFYDDDNDDVREVLFDTCFSAFHLVGQDIYRVPQGNPSGIVMTAVVNSLVNSLMMRIIFMELGGDITKFNDDIRLKTYGDDNIATVSKRAQWFNMAAITKQFAAHGIEFTNPDKTTVGTEECDKFLTLSGVSYLKRRFDERSGRIFGPLSRDSINEMINWIRQSNDDKEAVRMNYLAACREMYHYGRQEWTKFTDHVIQCARQKGFVLPFVTYEQSGEYWGSENAYSVILLSEQTTHSDSIAAV
jgi:hypothetical protein